LVGGVPPHTIPSLSTSAQALPSSVERPQHCTMRSCGIPPVASPRWLATFRQWVEARGSRWRGAFRTPSYTARGAIGYRSSPGVRTWSPTVLLVWPNDAYVPSADGMGGFHHGMNDPCQRGRTLRPGGPGRTGSLVGVSCESARGVRRLVRAFGRAARPLGVRDCTGRVLL
jgi:hypothetical protein